MIYSNNSTKEKFVFVDRTKARYDLSGNVAYQTHNGVNLKITKQDEHYGENVRNTIVVSERYAERNDLELGGAFKFKNNQTSYEFEVGAFGFDYDNSYPLIYDSDFIPDTKNEAIIFITADDFADSSSIMDTFVADSSKVYFRYYGNDLDVDTDKLNSALRFSPLDFTSTSDEVGNLNTLVYNLRTNAASYFSIGFF
ncbi:hypothetical protein Zmor_016354 [Zophobas morio]|uniref:Uncharacterized protein n=1 Tax=Zophobas morio TaxID=2755281 RepID=A0AA38HH05_9CUCU|nr:hypothetical protein Zmor_016354 [Zophobas morio]